MANPEHLEILKAGVEKWNEWRDREKIYQPDLKGAPLSGVDLSGAVLTRANLNGVKLHKANLTNAKLVLASLNTADLTEANLSGADISGSALNGAGLQNADLNGAILSGTDFSGANVKNAKLKASHLMGAMFIMCQLDGADFTRATLGLTVFAGTDLSGVTGLETVTHGAPSTIGLDTFFASKGKLPKTFLQGAGVPDIFLEYASSLAGKTIEFYSAFISYSSKDSELAERLHADLQAKGVRCWFAPEDLKIGDKFRPKIDEAIRVHDKLLLLLSTNSILSDWVEKEVESAFDRERRDKRTVLFPIRLDDYVMDVIDGWGADIRRTRHIGDFSNWKDHDSYQKAFNRLLRDLKSDKPAK